jgi:hypothetical protein
MSCRCSDRQIVIFLLIGLWFSVGLIGPGYDGLKDNAIPRLGVIFSAINDHALSIDQFADLGHDKAFFNGHYYPDKAPGLSMTAGPFVAFAIVIARMAHIDTAPLHGRSFTDFAMLAVHVATTMVNGLGLALTAVAVYLLARRHSLSKEAALFGSLTYGLASPAFGWATMFFGHSLAGTCLFLGFAGILATEPNSIQPRARLLCGAVIGGLLTWSCVVEYTSALAAAIIGLFALRRLLEARRDAALQVLAGVASGAVVALLPLLVYNNIAFDNPFRIGYQYVVGFEPMKQGTMGLSLPRAWVVWQLIFGQYRGILWLSPLLALLPLGWYAAWRAFPRDVVVVLVAVPVAYLLVNAGYFDWAGGYSTGPRHLVPSLAFVGLAFAALWDMARSSAARQVLLGLFALSTAISLACTSVTMIATNLPSEPMLPFLLDRLAGGDVHNVLDFALRRFPSWRAAGPTHLVTLLVLPLPWLAAFGFARLLPLGTKLPNPAEE